YVAPARRCRDRLRRAHAVVVEGRGARGRTPRRAGGVGLVDRTVARLTRFFTQLISETSGLALEDTLALAQAAPQLEADAELPGCLRQFHELLGRFRLNATPIESLLEHPVSLALTEFFRAFPIPFRDEHIHLSGSLGADFVYPRVAPLLEDPAVAAKVKQIYG